MSSIAYDVRVHLCLHVPVLGYSPPPFFFFKKKKERNGLLCTDVFVHHISTSFHASPFPLLDCVDLHGCITLCRPHQHVPPQGPQTPICMTWLIPPAYQRLVLRHQLLHRQLLALVLLVLQTMGRALLLRSPLRHSHRKSAQHALKSLRCCLKCKILTWKP